MGHFMQIVHTKDVQHLILLHDPLVPGSIWDLQLLHYHFIDVHERCEFGLNLIQDLLETTWLFKPGVVLLLMDGIVLVLKVLPCCHQLPGLEVDGHLEHLRQLLPVILVLIGGKCLEDLTFKIPGFLGIGKSELRVKVFITLVVFQLVLMDADLLMLLRACYWIIPQNPKTPIE